jgi:8-oxo-dGTP pyrophosphatase MutT (NUDIX family)
MVKETKEGRSVYNQPAGHLEPNESLQDAALRETLEETAWHIELKHALGVTLFTAPGNGVTYCRVSFAGDALKHDPDRALDPDIDEALWLSYEEIRALENDLRSPIVLQVIEEYLAGQHFPLNFISRYDAADLSQ